MIKGGRIMHTSTSEERVFASMIYFISFITAIFGPLILWFLKRDSEYVHQHGMHYTNFFISYFLYQAAAGFLIIIGIGFILNGILTVMMIVFTIIAGIKAFQGTSYKIPLVIRFLS